MYGRGSPLPKKAPAAVPAAVARFAAETPDRVAIVGGVDKWTYADLDARVRSLHERLRQAGVLHGDRVLVAMDRGPDLVAALLAASRAGATYVPVDPAHPPARIEAIAAQAAPRVAFADGVGCDVVPEGLEVIRTDAPKLLDMVPPSPVPVFPEAAAYMLFTSGSTGRPKGVVVPHRALETFMPAIAERLDMSAEDQVLASSTLGFDISVLEVLVPLTLGASVHMLGGSVCGHPGRVAAYLAAHPITLAQATPTGFRLWIQAGWKGDPSLKLVAGGEAMTPELVPQLLDRGRELWNAYGPTECTVYATLHRITREAPTPYLGTALRGTTLTIVDSDGRPSDTGELIIGGPQVGTGYFRDPVKTDAAFIDDPDAPGQLAYRTGDRVTRTEEGLVFGGRLDSQVKVRGVRIELGGVEANLLRHPAIAQCAVLLDQQRDELHAYGVLTGGHDAPSFDALRTHLEPTTFKAAWPARYVWLDEMPLTATGKVDRKALAALTGEPEPAPQSEGEPPASDMEWLVAKAWRQVLKLPTDPARDDNFTALGGTSYSYLEVVLRLERWIEVEIPTAAFIVCRTVAEQATLLEQTRGADAGLNAVRLSEGEGCPLFALCGVQLYEPLAAALQDAMPVYGVSVPLERAVHEGPDNAPSVEALAAECVEAIQAVRPKGPYRLAGSSFAGVVAFEVARRLQAAGETVEAVVPFDTVLPHARHSSVARKMAKFVQSFLQRGAGRGEAPFDPMSRWRETTALITSRYLPTLRRPEDLPVLIVRASEQALGRGQWVEDDLGWGRLAARSPQVREVAGDHLGILRDRGAQACAEAIKSFVASASSCSVPKEAAPSVDLEVAA